MHPFLLNTSFSSTGITNPTVFGIIDGSPYNWYNQGETWGSQYGLTYMWPIIYYVSRGSIGPSRTQLATGVFPNANGAPYPTDNSWQGIGSHPSSDVNFSIAPWNTSTGYIGLTLGSPGSIGITSAEQIVRDYRWIPQPYRVLIPDRVYRAMNGIPDTNYGITGTESILSNTPGPSTTRRKSHWLKRKANFLQTELNAFYDYCVGTGYIFSHLRLDDEFMDNYGGDLSTVGICGSCSALGPIGDAKFISEFLYSSNASNGVCWYSSFTGISAVPDCLVAEGITSMRSFLLTRGFTTTPGKWRYVDGLTLLGGSCGATANISISTAAAFRFFSLEYSYAIKDWISCFWTDFTNNFKSKFQITADNSLSGSYGYRKNNAAVIAYREPGASSTSNQGYVTNSFKMGTTDPVPYPDPTSSTDQKVQDYYSFNLSPNTLQLMAGMQMRRVGDVDDINTYGTINNILFANQGQNATLLDRNLDFRGNSYFYAFAGKTFGIGAVPQSFLYNKFFERFSGTDIMNQSKGVKYFPANYLGTNSTAQTLWLASCAELMGNSSFFQFDPTGVFGSKAGSTLRCGFDRAPGLLSWHLNPLWGLTLSRLGGITVGPANFLPQKGTQILYGVTCGSVTKSIIDSRGTGLLTFQDFDSCGYPFPGNTLPAGSLYNQYWTHWYPVSFLALMADVQDGRSVATVNVAKALKQIEDPANNPPISGSEWNLIQKPMNVWVHSPIGFYANNSFELANSSMIMSNFYSMPVGVSYGYYLESAFLAKGACYLNVEISPMYYENIRHQYLNKAGSISYWNPHNGYAVDSTGRRMVGNVLFPLPRRYNPAQTSPTLASGLTSMGVCGSIVMDYARKVNKVIGECNIVGNGLVLATHYLAPVNMDERSYFISGAQKIDGTYLWRITFAHPVTNPTTIVRGSVTGITTQYRLSGITDFVNNSNNKFGLWWTTGAFEIPIVDNPPISEGERFNLLNLPEKPVFEFNPLQMATARNPIDPYFVNNNPDIFANMSSVVGFAFQTEQWGSQNGLSYMWPFLAFSAPGPYGPSKACLAGGSYAIAYGFAGAGGRALPTTTEWPGIGEPVGNGDINWTIDPWNTSTGYIGMTFGSTGFIGATYIDLWLSGYTWIPNKYRVFQPSRHWRAIGNEANAIQTLEKVSWLQNNGSLFHQMTPWVKRKFNFIRKELNLIYRRMKDQGFTFAHYDIDDEVYSWYLDFRGIGGIGGVCGAATSTSQYFAGYSGWGNTYFYNYFMRPSNIPTGSSWYATFDGMSAAPDSMISAGITSLRGLYLARGFTSTLGNLRYVDGLTALGGCGACGNIALAGSAFQFFQTEYYSVLKDWLAYHWNDVVDDFKSEFGLVADNSLSGDYGYYSNMGGAFNYYSPGWTSAYIGKYAKIITKSSSSAVPYVSNPSFDGDPRVTKFYAFNSSASPGGPSNASFVPAAYETEVGDLGVIHPYGSAQVDITSNTPMVLDRVCDYIGLSYGNNISGITNNVNIVGYWPMRAALYQNYGPTPNFMYDSRQSNKWFPNGVFGMNHLPAQGVTISCLSCAEKIGQTGFLRYDPTGANGSCAPNPLKVSIDRAPHYVGWFLNPVWGITPERLSSIGWLGPANYFPIKTKEIAYGLTCAQRTVERTGTSTTLSTDNFDPCGNPFPGNTLPAGSLYNQYWTHWYPLGFMALLNDVRWGRQLALTNVAKANYQRENPTTAPRKQGSIWFGVQKPIVSWLVSQLFTTDNNVYQDVSNNQALGSLYYIPQGITFNYLLIAYDSRYSQASATGVTYVYGEAGPMYYENMRHQYLNKVGRFAYWNPGDHYYVTSESNTPIHCTSGQFPLYYRPESVFSNPRTPNRGITGLGICGAIKYRLARKVNTVIGECQNLGKGIVYETINLQPVNLDERSYVASGAQLVDGTYLWRITFAHPATQTPIIVRGSVTGITTAYEVNGITDYVNIPNSKFGIWWSSNYYENPIVENPPLSEAERLDVLNVPEYPAFIYDPITMERAERLPRESKDLFYTPNVYCNEGSATGVPDEWFGMRRETIATFQGIPQTGNQTGITDPKGRPYGSFEYNPTNPTVSSPWHNAVYELAIDPYKWGMRGFLMYWPYGAIPRYNYAMRYLELLDEDYFSSTTDAAKSPARIKGFTSAARALLEGKMTPSGFSAINQPCNVLLYSVGINGFYGYRWGETVGSTYYPGSMAFWDKCYTRTGSTAAANALYYSYLDRFVEDITSISRGVTASMFTVAFDSAAVAANPGTIQLFANLASPYTRGLSYELGEWYVINKLRQNDINVYVEARPLKVFSLADSGVTSGNISLVPGFCGATAISLWKNHLSVEYNLWFTDPAYAAGNPSSYFNKFVPNNEVRSVIRWAQNTGPLGTTWDPYKVPYKIFTQGASWTINYENGSASYLYTPQQSLFNLYTASDVYRKHKNSTDARNRYSGVAYDYITNGQIIEYNAISRGSCGALEVNPSFNASSLTGYYRVNTDNAFEGNRIGYGKQNAFNPTSFISNPVSYGTNAGLASTNPGWWTISGMSFWRQNVKQSSFTGFVQMLDNLSRLAAPPGGNTAGWTGMLYPYDTYTNGILPLSMREPERTPLVAFAWVWPANWVWSGNYTPVAYSADNINKVAYSGNLNVNRDFNNTTNIWVYQNIKSVNGGITAPDGSTTAFEFGTTAAGGSYAAISQTWYNIKPGTTYTFSYYRKTAPGASGGQIRIRDVSTSPAAYDTSVSLAFTNPGNWERKEYTFGTGLTQTALDFYILSRSNTATETSGVTVYLWGPQLEEGSTATTYKPTSGYRDLIGGCFLPSGFTLVYNQDKWLNYGACNGISYISPFVNLYRVSGWEISNMYGWTQASEIERIKGQLAGLPRGRKALQPTLMNREDWYYIYEDMLTATGAASHVYFGSTFPHPKSSASNIYPSAWPDTGISSGNSFYLQFLNLLSGTGITLDYVIGDNETNYVQNFSVRAADSLGSVTAYIQNPKYQQDWRGVSSYKSFMDFYGATVGANFANLNGPQSGDKVSYVVWNCIGRQNMQKGFNEMFGYPTMQRYPDAIVANYSNWESEGGPTAGPPDGYGHPQFSRGVVGNASSPFLYGEISQIDWRTSVGNVSVNATDTTYLNLASGASPPAGSTLTRNPWTSLILALQELRSVKRANPYGFVVPWIASVRYEGSLGANGLASPSTTYGPVVGFSDAIVGYNPVSGLTHGVAGNSAYYYELVRHTAMHGVKAIGYWNASSFQVYPTPPPGVTSPPVFDREYMAQGYTYYIRDMAHFDTVLRELNAKLGGYSPYTMTTSRISWYSTYLLSGAPAPTGGYNWRVTVKPGLTLLANGVTLSSSGSTVGTWIWTPGPTLTGIGLTFI